MVQPVKCSACRAAHYSGGARASQMYAAASDDPTGCAPAAGEAGAHVERARDVALKHRARRLLRVQRAEQLVLVVGGRHQQPVSWEPHTPREGWDLLDMQCAFCGGDLPAIHGNCMHWPVVFRPAGCVQAGLCP